MRFLVFIGCLLCAMPLVAANTYSTGAVNSYMANCGVGPDLPYCQISAGNFRVWYNFAGFTLRTAWNDGDVWGSDFRDGNGVNDADPSGGTEVPQVYFYNGHGICQGSPTASSPDFIAVCGNFGKPDNTDIGTSSRWGSQTGGNLQFAFIDASCPMDLVSLGRNWFPAFRGLHVAVGHSGDATHDTLNSLTRGGQFGAYSAGALFVPQLSVTWAWMTTGLIDVQNGTCAVSIAAGETEAAAVNRRETERVTDNRSNPTANWLAWRWVCK